MPKGIDLKLQGPPDISGPGGLVNGASKPGESDTESLFSTASSDTLFIGDSGTKSFDPAASADTLFIGPRTVQTHVTHLFAKLGANTRAELAVYAVRQGLV